MNHPQHQQPPSFCRASLHGYQERAAAFIRDTPSCALWVEMGLGKTATVLTAIADLSSRFEVGRVLVIAPLRVAVNTWPAEIRRWDHLRDLTARVITGHKTDAMLRHYTSKADKQRLAESAAAKLRNRDGAV